MHARTVAVDLAKSVFQVAVDGLIRPIFSTTYRTNGYAG
jgi:hypothetical protein